MSHVYNQRAGDTETEGSLRLHGLIEEFQTMRDSVSKMWVKLLMMISQDVLQLPHTHVHMHSHTQKQENIHMLPHIHVPIEMRVSAHHTCFQDILC